METAGKELVKIIQHQHYNSNFCNYLGFYQFNLGRSLGVKFLTRHNDLFRNESIPTTSLGFWA